MLKTRALTGLATLAVVAGSAVGFAPAASAQYDDNPVLQSVTYSAASVDVTNGPKTVTITVRATDPVKIRGVDGWLEASRTTGDRDWSSPSFILTKVSGTDTDATFSGTATLPAGAGVRYRTTLNLYGTGPYGLNRLSPDDLQVAGQPDGVNTVTTKTPAAISKISGRTVTTTGASAIGLPTVTVSGVVTFTPGAGGGPVRSWEIVSFTKSCGDPDRNPAYGDPAKYLPAGSVPTGAYPISMPGRTVGICTVKVRGVNGAGVGPTATVSFV